MSTSTFKDYFLDFEDLDFEISNRGGIDFKTIASKVSALKIEPLIIDISINGFSNKDDFDFEINGQHWKDVKVNFIKGEEAQKDPTALTVKRSMRLLAKSTSHYIDLHKITPNLKKYNDIVPARYCHLAGHFIVDQANAKQLLFLWQQFDETRKTKIADSVKRVLDIRFGSRY